MDNAESVPLTGAIGSNRKATESVKRTIEIAFLSKFIFLTEKELRTD